MDDISLLYSLIRNIPDFPQPGIQFKDITPILSDAKGFQTSINLFVAVCREAGVEKIVGIDARGFLFGAAAAYALGIGFVPVRKQGKLPFTRRSHSYTLEYGNNVVEMHDDAIVPGEKVALIDDLLATGGTAGAAAKLVADLGGVVVRAIFLIELVALDGRKQLDGLPVTTFLKY